MASVSVYILVFLFYVKPKIQRWIDRLVKEERAKFDRKKALESLDAAIKVNQSFIEKRKTITSNGVKSE